MLDEKIANSLLKTALHLIKIKLMIQNNEPVFRRRPRLKNGRPAHNCTAVLNQAESLKKQVKSR